MVAAEQMMDVKKLAGLPLLNQHAGLALYGDAMGTEYVVTSGQQLSASVRTIEGKREHSLFENGALLFNRTEDGEKKTTSSAKYVLKDHVAIGVYMDTDGDGVFDHYYDLENKKKRKIILEN